MLTLPDLVPSDECSKKDRNQRNVPRGSLVSCFLAPAIDWGYELIFGSAIGAGIARMVAYLVTSYGLMPRLADEDRNTDNEHRERV